ncbi:MAG: lipopolysaccharide biosynthesis protein [Steroidobacter sp.]
MISPDEQVRRWTDEEWLRRILRNAGMVLLGNGAAAAFTMIALLLSARALGAGDFGRLSMIAAYVAVADGLLNFQSWQALIRYGSEAKSRNDKGAAELLLGYGLRLDLTHALAGAMIACGGALAAARWFRWDAATLALVFTYSAAILFRITGTPTAILRLYDRFKLVAIHSGVQALVRLVFVAIAFANSTGLVGFVAAWAIADVVGNVMLWFFARETLRAERLRVANPFKSGDVLARFPGLRGFVWTTNLHSAIKLAIKEGDVLVVGALASTPAAGFYRLAKQIAGAAGKAVAPLYQTIYPELAAAVVAREATRFRQMLYRPGLLAAAGFLALLIVFVLAGRPLIGLLLGESFTEVYWTACVYLVGTTLSVGSFALHPALLALGAPAKSLSVLAGSVACYSGALIYGASVGGSVGAAAAFVLFYVVWTTLMSLVVMREHTRIFAREI